MSLRIPGAPPPVKPPLRPTEATRRPAPTPVDAPTAPTVPVAPASSSTSGTSAPVSAFATEMKMDQWVSGGEVSRPAPAVPKPPAVSEGGSAYGDGATAAPAMAPDQALLAADLVREDVLAQPPQASGIHGNLVAATVLNLLA